MPTYDYRCKSCEHKLELFQSMSEAPKKKCPACGKSTLERQIGAGAGFLFKGQGFYLTDYRSQGYKDAAKNDQGGASNSSSEKKGESTGGSKETPATKPSSEKNKKKAAE